MIGYLASAVFAAAFGAAALSLVDSARTFWSKAHELGLIGERA